MKNIMMKASVLLVGVFFLAGCLDDDKYALDPGNASNVIQFLDPSGPASATGSIYPVYVNSYLPDPPVVTYTIEIANDGPDDNDKTIELGLASDPAALELYNTQVTDGLYGEEPIAGDPFDLMPSNLYTMPASVTIPKGKKTVSVDITFNLALFDFSKNYALPLRIVSASSGVLSEHWSVALLAIGVRNAYDGVYTYEGFVGRWDGSGNLLNDGLAGNIVDGAEMTLTTASSNTLQFLNVLGSQLPTWASNASGVAGIGTPLITVNGDNSITLTPVGATPLDWGPIPGEPNDYDPITRTFRINYKWNTTANASPSSPTGTNRALMVSMTFIEPRP